MSVRSLSPIEWQRIAIQAEYEPGQMAAICRVSLRHLERHFAKEFHQTPKSWLRALRCALAVELLVQGHSNKQVAAELHFGSPSHFCHDFKKANPEPPQRTVRHLFPARVSPIGNKCRF